MVETKSTMVETEILYALSSSYSHPKPYKYPLSQSIEESEEQTDRQRVTQRAREVLSDCELKKEPDRMPGL